MAVIMQARWEGGTPAQLAAIVKQMGTLMLEAGAVSYELARIASGPHVGHHQVTTKFPNQETFARIMQKFMDDPQFQKAFAAQSAATRIADRTLLITVDG